MPTFNPTQLINPAGSTSGQAIVSTGSGTAPVWGSVDAAAALFTQSGTGAIARTVQNKLRDWLSAKDFGVVGDGVANDTTAAQNALNAAIAAKKPLYFPAGTYSITALNFGSPAYANQVSIFGDGPVDTILTKRTADANPFFTIGATSATNFISDLLIEGLQFKGGAAGSSCQAAVLCYDMVRTKFNFCHFTGAQAGVFCYGGITNTFDNCRFYSNVFGIRFDKFTSLAGGGYPNFNTLRNCVITDNTGTAVTIDNGRALNIIGCDIEGNGTTGPNTGGIYVGPAMGSELNPGGPYNSIGVSVLDCYFEINNGGAHIRFDSGRNSVYRSYFIQAGGTNTYDINITGGFYHLEGLVCDTTLTPNVIEGAGSGTGNAIINCAVPNITYTDTKTTVITGTQHFVRHGEMPTVISMTKPVIQVGSATPSSGGAISITFGTAFASTPVITCSPVDGSASVLDSIIITAQSATGFTGKVASVTSGSSTVNNPNLTFNWIAVGAGS